MADARALIVVSVRRTMQLDDLASLIRSRRTHMLVDRDRPIDPALVTELCDLAQWAPNHKRTWPWQFALVTGDARATLGETMAVVLAADGMSPERLEKTRGKYTRTPATLAIGCTPGDSPLRTAENRDAVAAGIQNVLLGATAVGLATYWGSCPDSCHGAVTEFLGFEPGTYISALIYLGWPVNTVEVPERPPVRLITLQ
jgi:nitroreductase